MAEAIATIVILGLPVLATAMGWLRPVRIRKNKYK